MGDPASEQHTSSGDDLRVVVRPLPKVVFLYPTWIACLVCAVAFGPDPGATVGLVWMGVFLTNLIVIAFDFDEQRTLIWLLIGAVAVLGLMYAGALWAVGAWLGALDPQMNRTFYAMIGAGLTVIFLFVFIQSRLDYWVFRPNEVVHRHGLFPKMERYGTEALRWEKSVPDLMERLLLGTGRIILTTPQERHPIVMEHVMRIGTIDDRIARILGVRAVVHEPHPGTDG